MIKLKLTYWLLLFCIVHTSIISFSQNNYSISSYTTKNGLPQNSVRTLCFDKEGFLWMATENGLVKFNGINFTVYNPTNSAVIASHRITQVFSIHKDTLLAYDALGNAFTISNGVFTKISNPNKNALNKTTGLSFIKYNANQINALLADDDSKRNDLTKTRSYTCGVDSFYLVSNKQIQFIYKNNLIQTLRLQNIDYKAAFVLNQHLYIVTASKIFYKYHLKQNKLVAQKTKCQFNKQHSSVVSYSQFPYHTAYLRSGNIICKLTENSNKELITENIISNFPLRTEINGIDYLANEKLLAIGTSTQGLLLYKEMQFSTTTYGINDSISNSACFLVAPFSDTTVLTTEGVVFSQSKSLGNSGVKFELLSLISDDEYNLYYYLGDNVIEYNKTTKQKKVLFTIKKPNIVSLLKHKNVLYIADKLFVYKWENGTAQLIVKHNLVTEQSIPYKLFINPQQPNELFISYCGGVSTIDIAAKKIQSIDALKGKCVRAINLYKNILLIGTYGNGWFAFYKNKLISLPVDKNGYLNYIHTLVIDANNNLWKATNNGLFFTPITRIEEFVTDTTKYLLPYFFGEEDGILNTEFNGVSISSYAKLKNGMLIFPSMDGLLWVNTKNVHTANYGSPLSINAMYVDDKLTNTNSVIKNTHNVISFTINTSYWGLANNIYIDYKLEGLKKSSWISLNTNTNKIEFNRLKGGTYTLFIRKQTAGIQSNSLVTKVTFYVQPQFVETPWFWVILFVIMFILFLGINKIRHKLILRKNLLLKQRIDEQTKKIKQANLLLQENVKNLELSKESLQQSVELKDKLISIISHDVITPLKFIALIARFGNQQKNVLDIRNAFGEIESASQKLQEHATNMLNWIRVQNNKVEVKPIAISPFSVVQDLMDTYRELGQLKPIEWINLMEEDDIIQADENILKILISNMLSNALKYTDEGKIIASNAIENNEYKITITDTGRGMSQQQLEYINTVTTETILVNPSEPGSGLGFIIMHELLALVNGRFEIQSVINKGTKVTISLPYLFADI